MPINKHPKPCDNFLEAPGSRVLNGTWSDTEICLSCEWPKSDHPEECGECVCRPGGNGEIWGPCEKHSDSRWYQCVLIAHCDCSCHVQKTTFKVTSKQGRKRLPVVLPYVRVKDHKYPWEE